MLALPAAPRSAWPACAAARASIRPIALKHLAATLILVPHAKAIWAAGWLTNRELRCGTRRWRLPLVTRERRANQLPVDRAFLHFVEFLRLIALVASTHRHFGGTIVRLVRDN